MPDTHKIYEIIEALAHPKLYNNTAEAIAALTEKELIQLSKDIADFHSKNVPLIIKSLRERKKEFNCYPLSFHPYDNSFLSPMALYSEQVVVRDPLADSFSNPAYSKPNVDAIKSSIERAISELVDLEPLVRAGVIQLVPFYALQESLGNKTLKQKIDEDLENERWKKEIKEGIQYKLYPEKNTLLLSIGPPIGGAYMCYKYARLTKKVKENDEELVMELVMPDSLVGYPYGITDDDISNWITSEINNEVYRTTEKLNQNLLLSEALNTTIVTNNDVYDNLLGSKIGRNKASADLKAISSIVKFTVPFADSLPFDKVAELREKEKESFLDLQVLLSDLSRKLEYCSHNDLQEQAQKIAIEEVSPLLRKLNREFDRIRKSAIIRSVPRAGIAFGTIAASVASGTPLIMALGSIASLKLFKDVSDEYAAYLEKELSLKDNAVYFLWKASKTSIAADGKKYRRHAGFPEKISVDPKEIAAKLEGLGMKFYPNAKNKFSSED